jgi:hypothetical protein
MADDDGPAVFLQRGPRFGDDFRADPGNVAERDEEFGEWHAGIVFLFASEGLQPHFSKCGWRPSLALWATDAQVRNAIINDMANLVIPAKAGIQC